MKLYHRTYAAEAILRASGVRAGDEVEMGEELLEWE